jgi:protein-L-isoaspartate O-methyltransferase
MRLQGKSRETVVGSKPIDSSGENGVVRRSGQRSVKMNHDKSQRKPVLGPEMKSFSTTLVILLVFGCGSGSSEPYRTGSASGPDGTGRFFMGREIGSILETEHLQPGLERPSRDVRELPARLIAALDLSPADRVADIGAGEGYYTLRLARQVPHGRVFAVDLQSTLLDTLSARAGRAGLRNIEVVLGTEFSPNLPAQSVDLVLIVVSYHEFTQPQEMLRSILDALRPGGRLVIVEYRGEDPTIPVPDLHRMTEAQARREAESVGFEWSRNLDALPQQHVFVFRRPGDA